MHAGARGRPNDIDAWLVIATVIGKPERKRQCLNHVLRLDPTNQIAREELLQMDRAAMGSKSPATDGLRDVSTSQSTYSPSSYYPDGISAFKSSPVPSARMENPLVFKSLIFQRAFVSLFFIVFLGAGLLTAWQNRNLAIGMGFIGMAFILGVASRIFSPKVEITEAGMRVSGGLLSNSEVKWSDIKNMKSDGRYHLELVTSNELVVKVSKRIRDYPRIVEIISQKRPDLFGITVPSSGQGNIFTAAGSQQISSSGYDASGSAPTFSGIKTFRKSSSSQYGILILFFFGCLVFDGFGLISGEWEWQTAILMTVVLCVLLIAYTLLQVNVVKVEPNRLTLETSLGQREWSALQIKGIEMKSIQRRHGRVSNYVVIVPEEGKKYSLAGFPESEEIMYGFLTNWWNTYKGK